MYENDIKLALWKNDKRDKPTQPILKGGKPQMVAGVGEMWVSAFLNAPKDDPEFAEALERMVDKWAEKNGTYPLISVMLSPAEAQTDAPGTTTKAPDAPTFDDDIPF